MTFQVEAELKSSKFNPVDIMEDLAENRGWNYERISDEEMQFESRGRWGNYRMLFSWHANEDIAHFVCQFDLPVSSQSRSNIAELLMEINTSLWLGHFDVHTLEHKPHFRYAIPLRGLRTINIEQLEDIIDTGLAECERFYPAFQLVIRDKKSAREALTAAIPETVGEA